MQCIFGNKENVDFYLNKIDGRSQFGLPQKAVLLGSDCHSFENIDNNLGKKFTWIKANPTFEGLRQILFEPELRVRIQEEHPYNDFPKPYFSCIKINETEIFNKSEVRFSKNEIPLNPDLVTIIGGRGTGKSLLLDSIAKTFNKSNRDRVNDIVIDSDNFSISYNKGESNNEPLIFKINETNNLDYLHISQGDVKEIVDPKKPEKIDNEIKRLLGEIEYVKKINTEEIERIIDELFEINDFLNKKNEDNKLINSIEYVDNEIKNKKQLIENITTKENRELIQKYTDNLREISRKDLFIEKLKKLKKSLKNFEKETNKEIDVINKNLDKDKEIPPLSFDSQIEKVENVLYENQQRRESLQKENENIQKQFIEKGIKGDVSSLLEKVKSYQNEIEQLDNQKKNIESKRQLFDEKIKLISDYVDHQNRTKDDYKKQIKNKWKSIKEGKETWSEEQKDLINKLLRDIDIEINEFYDPQTIVKSIKDFLNLKKFQDTSEKTQDDRIIETFNLKNKDSFINLIKGEKQIEFNSERKSLYEILSSDLFAKRGAKDFLKYLLINNQDFWKVITNPKYKNKTLNQLSVGMKGTMYVCLKLATDPFLKPFIFDQPEDDLDNDFIMNELVPIFKEMKKYRQIIIVTHNANLVVNTDAEQVIIAQNNSETISYEAGAIECIEIRENICKILEGGKDAFRKREQKYGFA